METQETTSMELHLIFNIHYITPIGELIYIEENFNSLGNEVKKMRLHYQSNFIWTALVSMVINIADENLMEKSLQYRYMVNNTYESNETRKIKLGSLIKNFLNENFNADTAKFYLVTTINDTFSSFDDTDFTTEKIMTQQDNEKVIVVLGKQLTSLGEPRKALVARMKKMGDILNTKPENENMNLNGNKVIVILTGGKAKQNVITEAEVMQNLLKSNLKEENIDNVEIILETEALTTVGNAFFSKKILLQRGFRVLTVLTSKFHLDRALVIFQYLYGDKYSINGIVDDAEDIMDAEELREEFEKEKVSNTNLDRYLNQFTP